MLRRPPASTLFPYTPLFRSDSSGDLFRRLAVSLVVLQSLVGPGRPQWSRTRAPKDEPSGRSRTAVLGFQRYFSRDRRSEEHTSELQSLAYLVCRLLLEKKLA